MLPRGVLLLLQIWAVVVSFEPLAKSCLTTKSVDTDIFSPTTLLPTTPTTELTTEPTTELTTEASTEAPATTTKFAGCTDPKLLFELLDGDTSISLDKTGPQLIGVQVTAECTRSGENDDTVIEGIVDGELGRQDNDNLGDLSESITLTCENDGTWSTVLDDDGDTYPGSFSEPNSLQCRDYYSQGEST